MRLLLCVYNRIFIKFLNYLIIIQIAVIKIRLNLIFILIQNDIISLLKSCKKKSSIY